LVGIVPVLVSVGVKVIVGVFVFVAVWVTVKVDVGVKTTESFTSGVAVGTTAGGTTTAGAVVGGIAVGKAWAFKKAGESRNKNKNFFKRFASIQLVNDRRTHL
jgi:hypothetical protein